MIFDRENGHVGFAESSCGPNVKMFGYYNSSGKHIVFCVSIQKYNIQC